MQWLTRNITNKQRILRWWTYFRRGHNTYLVFLMSFANFIVIQYRLLIEYVPFLKYMFSSLTAFALTFIAIYIPLSIIIGWLDYKKGLVRTEVSLLAQRNPFFKDLAKALILMSEGKSEEARKILEKWVKD